MGVDINKLIEDIFKLKLVIESVVKESSNLEKLQKISDKRLFEYSLTDKQTKQEIKSLQEMLTNYHEMVDERNKTREEVSSLKAALKEKCEKENSLEQTIRDNDEGFVLRIAELQDKQLKTIDIIQKQANRQAQDEREIYERKLSELNEKVAELEQTITDHQRQHNNQVAKIKLEYDVKMSKIQQRHLAQANTSSGSMAARNDIFRKKMQHIQEEAHRESVEMKQKCSQQQQTIVDLQHQLKLTNKQHQNHSKQHQEQVRQRDKLLRQYQTEIQRFQTQAKDLQETITHLQQQQQQENLPSAPPKSKRKKVLFNDKNNRLEQ